MVIKSFEIDFKGNKETVEFETELSFGETETIINKSIDLSDVNKPKLNLANYRKLLLLKTLRKAPFGFKNELVLNSVSAKVMNKVLEHITAEFPLVDFLGDWMMSFMGSQEENESLSEPTPSVQSSSDGQKEKQTSTEPSSSND
jgi:hypothetical protein